MKKKHSKYFIKRFLILLIAYSIFIGCLYAGLSSVISDLKSEIKVIIVVGIIILFGLLVLFVELSHKRKGRKH